MPSKTDRMSSATIFPAISQASQNARTNKLMPIKAWFLMTGMRELNTLLPPLHYRHRVDSAPGLGRKHSISATPCHGLELHAASSGPIIEGGDDLSHQLTNDTGSIFCEKRDQPCEAERYRTYQDAPGQVCGIGLPSLQWGYPGSEEEQERKMQHVQTVRESCHSMR